MSVDGGVAEFGQFSVITINRGSRDGVEVGHVLAAYRRGEVVSPSGRPVSALTTDFWGNLKRWWYTSDAEKTSAETTEGGMLAGSALKLPDERNGLIFVFRVFEKMSYAMVMKSSRPIYLGDIVQTP